MVFSAPRPLWNQLSAMWLAGFAVTALMAAGAAVRFLGAGEMRSLLSIFAGALFIPSLALMFGVWTGSSKTFEIIYVLVWYGGPLNKLLPLDYIGIYTNDYWQNYILLSIILILLAVVGRIRQMQGR
jgi:hypothetical protein